MTKKQKLKQEKNKNYRLMKMLSDERQMVAGYEQLAKIHSAYISILLNRLEATKDKPITITSKDVKEALTKYEARAIPSTDGFRLYCEVTE